MTEEYTVHFQKGVRVGARSLHMETVNANSSLEALRLAKAAFPEWRERRYKVIRIDRFGADGLIESTINNQPNH